VTARKQLNKRQSAVIEDMFAGDLDNQAILEKHRVSPKTFNRWLGDDEFMAELSRRLEWLNLQGELVVARYKSLAAARLVQLTESEKEETARKACLDIISLPKLADNRAEQPTEVTPAPSQQQEQMLSPEACSRLLAVLAEEIQKTVD
jgi:3-deoxy-D-manno-octulosonic-acid transferase